MISLFFLCFLYIKDSKRLKLVRRAVSILGFPSVADRQIGGRSKDIGSLHLPDISCCGDLQYKTLTPCAPEGVLLWVIPDHSHQTVQQLFIITPHTDSVCSISLIAPTSAFFHVQYILIFFYYFIYVCTVLSKVCEYLSNIVNTVFALCIFTFALSCTPKFPW